MVEALEGYELAEIMDKMHEIQEKVYPEKSNSPFGKKSWREAGCVPRMVLEWCRERNIPCTVLQGPRACEVDPAQGGKPRVGCWWEGHAYFWKEHAAVKVGRRGIHSDSGVPRLAKQASKE